MQRVADRARAGRLPGLRVHAALYVALLCAHAALVWLLPFVPTQDGPNHVYNLVLLRDLLRGTGDGSGYHELGTLLVPNLGFQLVACPLLALLEPLAVERAFLTAYLLGLGASVPVFLRALGRPAFPASHFALLVMFNFPALLGFYGFISGVPLLLLAVAAAWSTRRWGVWRRAAVVAALGGVLFFAHLVPCVVFVLASALMAWAEGRSPAERARQLAAVVPVVMVLGLYVVARGGGEVSGWRPPWRLIQDLLYFSSVAISPWQRVPGTVALGLVAAGAALARRSRPGPAAGRFLRPLVATLVVVYFAAPRRFGGGSLFNERLPWMILLLALPLLGEPARPRWRGIYAAAVATVAAGSLWLNASLLCPLAERVEQFTRGIAAGVPRGATLVAARFDDPRPWPRFDPLLNAAAHYGLDGAVVLGNYAALERHFPVRFREHLGELPAPLTAYLRPRELDWSRFPVVQYLVAWRATPADAATLDRHFTLAWHEGDAPVSVWKRRDG